MNVGSGQFIPGFEEQLIGMAAGETRTVKVTFPETYPTETLAGKAAEFDVTAKSIEAPSEVTIDDEFAKSLGLEVARQAQGRGEGAASRASTPP